MFKLSDFTISLKRHEAMRAFFFFAAFFLSNFHSFCQNKFSDEEILQGYAHSEDQTIFLFDSELYGLNPSKVVVTGSFRGWDQDMSNKKWELKKVTSTLWELNVDSSLKDKVLPQSEFKFRVDNGDWLNSPQEAINVKGGNLVFLPHITPPTLKAELVKSNIIRAYINGLERSLNPSDYLITTAKGEKITASEVLPNSLEEILIVPSKDLDIKRVYFLEIPKYNLKSFCSFDGWFKNLYSNKPLGAIVDEVNNTTTFRLFSPRANRVILHLYEKRENNIASKRIDLAIDNQGVWETNINQNLYGFYYDYTVYGANDTGNHFYETNPIHISDPYAKVSNDTWGKSRVWRDTEPASPLKGGIPKMEDVIAYEVHVQDFTHLLPVSPSLKGTFKAMGMSNLRNKYNQKIGFDYLVDLGVNVVHLMPVQEFLHYPDSIWKDSFKDDPYMIQQEISEENYQWGYRTSHAFALESRFREKGKEPGAEREQFKDLVQAFHDKGIAVIVDIVPNHTAENMDGEQFFFHFNVLDKYYYYRTKDGKHIGAFGNEVKTENRPMVQRWLIDQCMHLISEFGIDGFRIDLAGQIDQQTLIKLKDAIGHDKILYGEPWIASNDPDYEENPDWDWYKEDAPITFFQDESRNAFKGSVSNPEGTIKDKGFAGGDGSQREKVMMGLSAGFEDDITPLSGINYLDIHDNWALADRFAKQDFNGLKGVNEDAFKIAAVLLFTSLGPVVMHGGTEIMRSKGIAPLEEIVKETTDGIKVYIHGKRDTYNLKRANQFIWENVGKRKGKNSPCDYKGMYSFWKGLIHFRKSDYGKPLRISTKPDSNYFKWFLPKNEGLLGYRIDDKIMVLINTTVKEEEFNAIVFPEGKWKLIANNRSVNHLSGIKDKREYTKIEPNKNLSIKIPPKSFKVWVKG